MPRKSTLPRTAVLLVFDTLEGATKTEIKNFIKTELTSGGGNRHPYDPLFGSLKNLSATFVPGDGRLVRVQRNK
jgi:hypothetical protein